jgi:hypothetical protein
METFLRTEELVVVPFRQDLRVGAIVSMTEKTRGPNETMKHEKGREPELERDRQETERAQVETGR